MERLITYINEAREIIGDLPFTLDQFKEFLQALEDLEDESTAWKSMESLISSSYGQNVWSGFMGWCEGNARVHDAETLYNMISRMPKSRIQRVLGSGSFGSVVDAGDRIIKLLHGNVNMSWSDRDFYEYCLTHKSKVFPIVYKLGERYVVMEKLKTNTPKCRLYDKWCGPNAYARKTKDFPYTIEEIAKRIVGSESVPKVPPTAKECLDWAVQVLKELNEAVGWDSFSDLRLANLGERKDGSIIWFDI